MKKLSLAVSLILFASLEPTARAEGFSFGGARGGFGFDGGKMLEGAGAGLLVGSVIVPLIVADVVYAAHSPGERRMPTAWRAWESTAGTGLVIAGAWLTYAGFKHDIGTTGVTIDATGVHQTVDSAPWIGLGVSLTVVGVWFIGHSIAHWIDPLWAPPKSVAGNCGVRSLCWDF